MSDRDVQRALHVLKRNGLTGEDLLEIFPSLKHDGTYVRLPEFSMERYQLECSDEYGRWFKEIPSIEIPEGWSIQMRPPIVGAIVRFLVNNHVSVYLDCYNRLGIFGAPYWEIYPAEDGDTERYAMEDAEGLVNGIKRALHILS